MKRFYLLVIVLVIALSSCKDSSSSSGASRMALDIPESPINNIGGVQYEKPSKDVIDSLRDSGFHLISDQRPITMVQVSQWREQAKGIIEYRKKEKPKCWSILDVNLWAYQFIFESAKMKQPKPVDGYWIDFDEKFRYLYGHGQDVEGQGSYHYDFDTSLLMMLDDNENVKPSEFRVKLVNDVCLLQGHPTFRDNGFQAKLEKVLKRPDNPNIKVPQ